jgi:accessory gene regulator protein AgrB
MCKYLPITSSPHPCRGRENKMLVLVLVAILLAILFPGFMRGVIILGLILGGIIFVASIQEAGEMHQECQRMGKC